MEIEVFKTLEEKEGRVECDLDIRDAATENLLMSLCTYLGSMSLLKRIFGKDEDYL